jgi:hypothetical protein
MTAMVLSREGVRGQLQSIAEKMQDPNADTAFNGFVELREFLMKKEFRENIYETTTTLGSDTFAVIWLLRKFFGDLWQFSGDSQGFPEERGGPLIDGITNDVSSFLLWFLKEGNLTMSNFAPALEKYHKLVHISWKAAQDSEENTSWVCLP